MKFFFILWMALIHWHADAAIELNLPQVVKQGVDFSPEIKKAEAALAGGKELTSQRRRLLFPKVDLLGTAKYKEDPSRFTTISSALSEDYDAAFKLTQPIYRGGILLNAISSYKTNETILEQQLFHTRQVMVATLVNAYFDLEQAQRQLTAVEEHFNVLKEYANIVARYEQNGRSRRMDRLQSVVNLSLTHAEQVRLRRLYETASDVLKKLLGLSPEQEIKLSSVAQKKTDKIAATEPIQLAQALQAAEKNNPELRIAQLTREKTKYDNAMEQAEDRPELNLEGSYGYRAADRGDWMRDESNYYAVGLSLKIPIFSGLTSLAKRRVHSEKIKQEDRAVEIRRLDLQEKIEAALLTVQSEYERLNMAQTASRQGREALQLANTAFGRGVATTQDVLNAQSTRYSTEKLLIESEFAYGRALLSLYQLMGRDLEQDYSVLK